MGYGYCGITIHQEIFINDIENATIKPNKQKKPNSNNNSINNKSYNNNNFFTPIQKLYIALDLALPIYHLHQFNNNTTTTKEEDNKNEEENVVVVRIVHNDIQLSQYLYTKNNNIKLNDFNRAEILFIQNNNKKNYCTFYNGKVYGRVSFVFCFFYVLYINFLFFKVSFTKK